MASNDSRAPSGAANIIVADKNGRPVGGFAVNGRGDPYVNARSILQDRLSLGRHGTQFSGDRDYYSILGYPEEPTIADYRGKFERDGLAAIIVEFPAAETWRDKPTIRDGEDKDAKDDTQFTRAWRDLAERLRVYHYCRRVDTLTGLGQYGCLLIGTAGSTELSQPVERLSGPQDVLYLRPYSQEAVTIKELETDPGNARFGLPSLYTVKMLDVAGGGQDMRATAAHDVHWSRVIHVAEGLLENEIYGRPRLQRVYNLLDDLLKVIGGSAEATWLLMRKGFVLNIDGESSLTPDEQTAIEEQFAEYMHGLRRMIQTRNMEVSDLGSEVVNPSAIFEAIVALISAATRIPQRILLGSERGELASSQDAGNWAGHIASRRLNFAEPVILRPLIDRLVQWGAIPKPDAGRYSVGWEPLFEQSDADKANIMQTVADALHKASQAMGVAPMTPEEFRREYTPLPEEVPAGTQLPMPSGNVVPNTALNQFEALAVQHGYSAAESRAIVVAAARVLSRAA